MKKKWILLGLVAFMVGSLSGVAQALPSGPGGTVWISVQSGKNDNVDIYVIDIDENWDPVNTPGVATVVEDVQNYVYPGNIYDYYTQITGVVSMYGEDSVVLGCYYDNDVVAGTTEQMMDALKIEKDGTITVLHDGAHYGWNKPLTDGARTAVADVDGLFGTKPNETNPALYLGGAYSGYGDSVWHDSDGDDNYDESANAVRVASPNKDDDAELFGNTMYTSTTPGFTRPCSMTRTTPTPGRISLRIRAASGTSAPKVATSPWATLTTTVTSTASSSRAVPTPTRSCTARTPTTTGTSTTARSACG